MGVDKNSWLFYKCCYVYCVMCIFYKYKEGCVISFKVIVKGNIVYYGRYIKFMYIVVNVVIWCVVCFNFFVVILNG